MRQECVRPETKQFIEDCVNLITKNIKVQKETGEKSLLQLPIWDADIALEDVEKVIKQEKHLKYKQEMKTLVKLIEFTEHEMSVHVTKSTELVISYDVVVPDELQNIVVLDASTEVNELMMLDKSIHKPENFPEIPVKYLDTVVHRIDHPAGRTSTEEALKGDKLPAAILEILRKHPLESILFFTYKPRNGELNHRQAIEDYLTQHEVDINEQINGKNRLNWLTHGNETASNKYAHCTVAIFAGVLFENEDSYVSKTVGQSRDHTSVVHAGCVTKVLRGIQAQAVHQGLNRCASRKIKDDVAGPVNVYYTYPDESLSGYLQCVLPDADFRVYDSKVLQPRTKKGQVLKVIIEYLMGLPETILKVTSKELTKVLPELSSLSKSHRRRVNAELNDDPSIPWTQQGRTWVRA
jgi:hypothetical protein